MNIPPPLTNPSKKLDHISYDLVISTWTAMKDNKKVGHNVKLITLKKGSITFTCRYYCLKYYDGSLNFHQDS